MPYGVLLDVFESPEMEKQLSRTLEVTKTNLVRVGLGDISWHCGHNVSLEHKTIEQVMMEMGQRLDEQLRKHCDHAEEVGLVIDGLVTPVPGERACYLWRQSKDGNAFFRATDFRSKKPKKIAHAWEDLIAYLYSIWGRFGITSLIAPTTESLCLGISAMVHNSHKLEHNTLTSYVKHKPILWQPDPLIETWMGLSHAYIGEATGKQLKEVYGTPYNSFIQSRSKWKLTSALFDRIMTAIGRST